MKTKIFSFIACSFITVFTLFSQEKNDYSEKGFYWYDDFSSNKNNWNTSDSKDYTIEISNGHYNFEHKKESGGWTVSKEIKFDNSKDFEIESKVTLISGVQTSGYGILFGRKDNDNQYLFQISGNGQFSVDEFKGGKFTNIKPWKKSAAIKKGNGAVNTLKIVREGPYIKFYVNDTFLTLYYFKEFFGDRIGYFIYKNQKIAIDGLSIKYVKSKSVVKRDAAIIEGDVIIDEGFNNNTNSWALSTTADADLSVSEGNYNFDHKRTKEGWSTSKQVKIDTDRDFQIESNVLKISGVYNNGFGISFGRKDSDNEYVYNISSNGYYKIFKQQDKKYTAIKAWTKTSSVKQGNNAYNKFKVVKENNNLKFYINEVYLYSTPFEGFKGDRIGFVVYNKQKIAIDYLKVSYLKKSANTVVTNNTIKTPLKEEFSSNTNGWSLTNNSNIITRISNGKLYVKSNDEKGGAFIGKKIDINTQKDFTIETSITRLTSASNGTLSLVFGRKNTTNQFDLFLSKSGMYLFRKLDNNVSTKPIPWTASTNLKKEVNQPNKIKIIKSGQLLRLYINDVYANEAPFTDFLGQNFGFSVYKKQEISVDYLRITYQNNKTFNEPPVVVINEPIVQRGFKIVKTKKILVRGKATDTDGIYEIVINGIEASIKEDGSFTANVPLKIGTNDLVVKATDLKQVSSTKTFTIKRKSPDVVIDDAVVVTKDEKIDFGFGEYYALLIGVSEYGDGAITDLNGLPAKDAKDLGDVLVNKYNFKRENVVVLNSSPKANDIIKEFSKLKKKVGQNDNLLVFYAGHGVYDDVSQIGHWLPSDADMEYELNLISNSQVVDFLKSIRSKHTLLISDACFSGSIFKSRSFVKAPKSVQKKYELTSRKAITSGTLKTVPNKSMFLKYLLMRLNSNSSKYLSARQLFDRIEEPVMNNSPNTPQYGTIHGIGDEGGDFIFIKKE